MTIDELGSFWVVTRPTKMSTIVDICFEATTRKLMLQALGGLRPADVLGVYKSEDRARKAARFFLDAAGAPVPGSYRKGLFQLGSDDASVEGYTRAITWNGFACPVFTPEQFRAFVETIKGEDTVQVEMGAGDAPPNYVITFQGCDPDEVRPRVDPELGWVYQIEGGAFVEVT